MGKRKNEIVIVGVCAAGKSTLAHRLQRDGRYARTVAQEHSCIPDLWRHSGAATTIYLHASYQAVKRRRTSFMNQRAYEAQLHRLREARTGATVRVDTSDLSPEEVYSLVASQLPADREGEERRPVIPDEPGSDIQPRPTVPAPVADEPGQEAGGERHEGLPIPEEL